ncbi:PAS domain S-box protein [Paraburkholderia sp. PREW-6R]|uniref:PAS domain-containing hybrid sensor histidine kinase/response regulator n=1 Tax=Paraburkholderia sp. PREW-6R TaxID=3141544 RepID=UPI0031F47B5D
MDKDIWSTIEHASQTAMEPAPARFLPAFVWRASRDGLIRYANPWAIRYLGLPPDAVIGQHWKAFVAADDVSAVLEAVRLSKDAPLLRNVDVRLRRADGDFRWHTLHLQASRDAQGEIADTVGVAIDMHECKDAWALYEASERRLRAAFQAARMGAWEWNVDTHMVHVTAELASMYALPENTESVTVEELTRRVAREDRSAFQRKLFECSRSSAPFQFDFRMEEHLAPVRWLRTRAHSDYDTASGPVRVHGVTFDISDQRAQEEQLSLSERRYRALVESTGAMVWSAEPDGAMRPAGGPWEEFIGADASHVAQWAWLELIHPDDRNTTMAGWQAALQRKKAQSLRLRVRRKDGVYRIMRVDAAPLCDQHGQLQEWFGTMTDITAREEAKAAIAERNLRLAVATQAAKLRIVTLDLSSCILSIENGGERHRIEHVPYLAVLARVHPDDRTALDGVIRGLASGDLARANFEFRILHVERAQWFQGSALLERGDHERPVRIIGSVIDITERKRMELMLRESSQRKDEFLAMLAHELRNPLAPLRTAIALKQRDAPPSEREAQLLGLMQRQTDHMTRIVDDLLEVSRITQGRITLKREPMLVCTAVYHAVEAVAALVETRSQHIQVDVPDATSWISGDVTRMSQILVNILNNASKYTPEGGHISISAHTDRERVCIMIADTGSGIAPELLPKIFDLFSQGERTLDRSEGGLGIGLSLVKKLVEMHDGTISVQSPGPGLGTTVTVDLPRLLHHERHAGEAFSSLDIRSQPSVRRILIVDDNRDAADSLGMLCETENHQIRVAYSAAEALEVAKDFQPDVALLDIGLPVMDGYELAGRLRATCDAPLLLIAITGYGQPEDRVRAQAAGFDLHFVKPVKVESLLESLSSRVTGDNSTGRAPQ